MPLIIEEQPDREATRMVLIGKLDVDTATGLADRCLALRRARVAVRVDLSQIKFMDGFGAGVLRAAMRHAELQGCGFEVGPHMRPRVRALLHLAGLHIPPPDGLAPNPSPGSETSG